MVGCGEMLGMMSLVLCGRMGLRLVMFGLVVRMVFVMLVVWL